MNNSILNTILVKPKMQSYGGAQLPQMPTGTKGATPMKVQFRTLEQLPQQQKDEMFIAAMRPEDVVELPLCIFVETRFIFKANQSAATVGVDAQTSADNIATKNSSHSVAKTSVQPKAAETAPPPPIKRFANASVYAGIVQKECGTLTDSPNPVYNRLQQTEATQTATIGIQCSIEDDLEFENIVVDAVQPDSSNEVVDRLNFICEKSMLHSNGKMECLICGEVTKNAKFMESHMLLHWGPKALCFRCGILCENELNLRDHDCEALGTLKPIKLRCPQYNCRYVAISKLELYDHINTHCPTMRHKCKGCEKSFISYIDFDEHLKLRKACRGASKSQRFPFNKMHFQNAKHLRYRVRMRKVYTFKGIKALRRIAKPNSDATQTRSKQCPTCLKICSNSFKFMKHRKRCLRHYGFLYKRKCSEKGISIINAANEASNALI